MIRLSLVLFSVVLLTSLGFAQAKPKKQPPQKPVATKPSALQLITHEQQRAKTAYLKSKTATAKAYYIKATMALANAYMNGNYGVPPKVKYPKALTYYREVIKVDPSNRDAISARDTIVSIYKSMGRPVPGGG